MVLYIDMPLKFPADFLWGTAASAHQVEGSNTHNDWWQAEQNWAGQKLKEPSGKTCDHYHRFEEDFALAQKIHTNAHRLSLEWSRIEPKEGEWAQAEIEHYRLVLRSLKSKNIKTMATLHHFTNPVWFSRQGGWQNQNAPEKFQRFAQKAAGELGDLVDFWITINEPTVLAVQGYLAGRWTPFLRSPLAAFRVIKNLVRANSLAYQSLHRQLDTPKTKVQIGVAHHIIYFHPFARLGLALSADWLFNDWTIRKTARDCDFLGLNYYRSFGASRSRSDLGWEVYPDGLEKLALKYYRRHKKPIYITENGIAATDDKKRQEYLLSHINAVALARQKGVDIRGYFHWSLLDNFEWALGFTPKFGLIEVDFKTLERHLKPSALLYRKIIDEAQE